jgi:hypothetical protein
MTQYFLRGDSAANPGKSSESEVADVLRASLEVLPGLTHCQGLPTAPCEDRKSEENKTHPAPSSVSSQLAFIVVLPFRDTRIYM